MPVPQMDWNVRLANPLVVEQLQYVAEKEHTKFLERLNMLNDDQRQAYTKIIASLDVESAHMFFLNGPAGTGKTFVYKTICNKLLSEGQIVLVVASSGIAAVLILGGWTAHSMFKIPLDDALHKDSVCSVPKNGHLAELFRRADLLIWDEVGMQHWYAPEAVDHTLRDIRQDDRPFGNLPVVFGGDFQQILPVIPCGSKEDVLEVTLQHSRSN